MQLDITKLAPSLLHCIELLHNTLGPDAKLHLVGGVVRDLLQDKTPDDLDLSSAFSASKILELTQQAGIIAIRYGFRRDTVLVTIEDVKIEITTFRNPENETQNSDSILEDLSARDFTINAMAYCLNTKQLIDPYNGLQDLQNKLIKCVGDPHIRFKQDPHRIIRMARFGPSCDFTIDHECLKAVPTNLEDLIVVPKERLYKEFIKILISEHPSKGLRFMCQVGIVQLLLPELSDCIGVTQNKYHLHDVFDHIMNVVDATPPDKLIRMAALFHDMAKPESKTFTPPDTTHFLGHEITGAEKAVKILRRFNAPSKDIEVVHKLVLLHMKDIRMCRKKIRRLKIELNDHFPLWIELKKADILFGGRTANSLLKEEWADFEEKVATLLPEIVPHKLSDLEISGKDLIEHFGLKPSPKFSKILSHLYELVLDEPEMNTKENLLAEVGSMILSKHSILEE